MHTVAQIAAIKRHAAEIVRMTGGDAKVTIVVREPRVRDIVVSNEDDIDDAVDALTDSDTDESVEFAS